MVKIFEAKGAGDGSTFLSIPTPDSPDISELIDKAHGYVLLAKSPATLAIYRRDCAAFVFWCQRRELTTIPAAPETVALYLTERAHADKSATLSRRVASISQTHQAAGFDSPTMSARVRITLQGICRALGTAQTKKVPALLYDLRAMTVALPRHG